MQPAQTTLEALRMQSHIDAREDLIRAAYRELRSEFITAAFANPLSEIRTPGFPDKRMRLVDVVSDMFCGRDELHLLDRIVSLIVTCAEGEDPATRLPANALLMCMAHQHAQFHAEDTAEQDGSDA
jgi:hypothetical protein